MIITTYDKSVGIDFKNISSGRYHSHRIYRHWFTGGVILKINFLEGRLTSSDVLTTYKFKFDVYMDATYIIGEYIKQL